MRPIGAPTRRAPPVTSTSRFCRGWGSSCVVMRGNDTGFGVPMLFDEDVSDDERRHVLRVREAIAQEIAAAGGWISFERYMDLALYAPGLGYYSAGARKLGAGGE